jgi:hypothetical protein
MLLTTLARIVLISTLSLMTCQLCFQLPPYHSSITALHLLLKLALLYYSAGTCKQNLDDKNCGNESSGNCPRSPKELCLMDRYHECCTDCDCANRARCKGLTCDPCTRKCSGLTLVESHVDLGVLITKN